LTDTQASINPLSTQGKAFRGEMSMLNNATLVKTCHQSTNNNQLTNVITKNHLDK